MVRMSIARLVPQPRQCTSINGMPAITAQRIVGDHSAPGPDANSAFERRPRGQQNHRPPCHRPALAYRARAVRSVADRALASGEATPVGAPSQATSWRKARERSTRLIPPAALVTRRAFLRPLGRGDRRAPRRFLLSITAIMGSKRSRAEQHSADGRFRHPTTKGRGLPPCQTPRHRPCRHASSARRAAARSPHPTGAWFRHPTTTGCPAYRGQGGSADGRQTHRKRPPDLSKSLQISKREDEPVHTTGPLTLANSNQSILRRRDSRCQQECQPNKPTSTDSMPKIARFTPHGYGELS